MVKRCLIYLRVSTAEQAGPGHHSLDAQEILCRRYAESQGLEITEVIRDEGYSGRTTNRPGLRRLLEFTGQHPPVPIDVLLVQDTSRMGRDTTEYLLFRRTLREKGIELVSVTQPNIDSSPEGRLMDTIFAGVNQYQSEEKGRRVAIALQKKFEEGWWPCWAPLGYLNAGQESRRLVISDPERYPLVQWAFNTYATGHMTQVDLLKELRAKGLCNRQGRPLSHTTLNDILANPFYWGLLCWHGEKRMGKHEPATDQRTWEQCQQVTAMHNHYTARVRKHVFLLTGLTRCDACGNHHTHTVVARKRKRYYHCKSQAKCTQPYIPEDELERQVEEMIREIRLTDEFIERVIIKVKAHHEKVMALETSRTKVLLRRQEILKQQRDVLEEKLLSEVLTDDAFSRHIPRITAELDEIARELRDIEEHRQLDTDALREILRFARDIPVAYAKAPKGLKKQYLKVFFKELVVRDKRIIRTVWTELFEALKGAGKFDLGEESSPGCTLLEPLIALLKRYSWIEEQRKVIRASTAHAA